MYRIERNLLAAESPRPLRRRPVIGTEIATVRSDETNKRLQIVQDLEPRSYW